MAGPMFSIIVVSLNAGDKLLSTIKSIHRQTFRDYEIIVKDAGSGDGSVERMKCWLGKQTGIGSEAEEAPQEWPDRQCVEEAPQEWPGQLDGKKRQQEDLGSRLVLVEKPDRGIYDGMNQAAELARGEYLYFLNCGDLFYGAEVLWELAEAIKKAQDEGKSPLICYGDIYDALNHSRVPSNPHLDGFACYRNLPCHQACLYARQLFGQRGYELSYKVRADYEHFLWCLYRGNARPVYVPLIIASYEGGGFSETPGNRRLSREEHRVITALYMTGGERFRYRLILMLTLAPLRTWMAHSPVLSGFYNKCKTLLYGRKA